ncbi:MAG: hypothetical protein CVT92_17330 [Bacteroidetes bacterium HGW-Bacteroidetes-1]|jgi:cell wall-associated NlpC family hydrolase|nr:MAG: hypothetical protein CVT92_17330 [Bacteroidetes bacterium HGW-Bacteroidetes-1]
MKYVSLIVFLLFPFWLSGQNVLLLADNTQVFTAQRDTISIDSATCLQSFDPVFPIDSLINFSRKYIGTPYKYGGVTEKGFDCSGFVQHVFKQFGLELPHSSRAQVNIGSPVKIDSVRKGDLLFFKGRNIKSSQIGHVAIVADVSDTNDVQIIHSTRHGLKAEWLSQEEYFKKRFIASRRIDFESLITK